MKKILVLLAAMVMTIGANAQNRVGAGKDYNRVEISYAPMFFSDYASIGRSRNYSSMTAHGFKAGYVHGIHLSKKWPMFIEAGANLQYNRKNVETFESDDDIVYVKEAPLSILRLNIPVAFTWRFAVGSKKLWKISPYTGFNFGINLLYKIDGNNMFKFVEDYGAEWGFTDDDFSANRFQFGLIEGVNFTYKRWNFGVNYVIDLMYLTKSRDRVFGIEDKNYTGTLAISAGYEF